MARSKELTVLDLKSLKPNDIGERIKDKHSLYGVVKPKGEGVSVLFRWRYRISCLVSAMETRKRVSSFAGRYYPAFIAALESAR